MNQKYNIVREPIYQQINQCLKQLISEREFVPGDKFLSEREVSKRFNVSRATANKAISNLIAEGLLNYKKGVGTFVTKQKLNLDLSHLMSFTKKARSAGFKPSTKVIVFKKIMNNQLPFYIKQSLNLNEEQNAYYFERLRLIDDLPIILEKRYLISHLCPSLRREDLEGSLYNILIEKFNLNITGAKEKVRSVILDKIDLDKMCIKEKEITPFLKVEAIGYIDNNKPLWVENTFYHGDMYYFYCDINKDASLDWNGKIEENH